MAKGITDTSNYSDIADAIRDKNGSSDTYKPSEMAAAITAIPSGGGGEGIPREVSPTGIYGYPAQQFTFSLPSTAINLSNNALSSAFYNCLSLTSVDLSSLTTVSGSSALSTAFYGCTSLTSVDLSSLTTANGSNALIGAFNSCSSLTSVDLSSLTTVSGGSAFGNAFRKCTSLTSLSFPALTASSFGTNTNQFNGMLGNCSNVTVHFPASIQSTIGSWASVTSGFNGTNTTVLFDL